MFGAIFLLFLTKNKLGKTKKSYLYEHFQN